MCIMKLKDFLRKISSRFLLLHLLAMLLVIILLCFGVKYGLAVYTHHGEGVRVPDLNGVDYQQAVSLLEKEGLYIDVADSGYNQKMPANCILTQTPGAGTNVKVGRKIVVTINATHSRMVPLPDIIDNSSYREARARLVSIGFQMLDPMLIEGERDWVYGVVCNGKDVHAGEKVPVNAALMLVIGKGQKEENEEDLMLDIPDTDSGEADEFVEIP